MGLTILRMADGLVTLVDEVNLKGASLLVRKGAQEGICDPLHETRLCSKPVAKLFEWPCLLQIP